jgi:glycosyltransferase involved in cell wall biosynthesis
MISLSPAPNRTVLEKDSLTTGSSMNRLRILLLAPFCDPDAVSMPYVAYSHAAALAKLHDVTLVVGGPVEDKVRRAKAPFQSIEVIRMPLLERTYAWSFRRIFKSNYDTQIVTAFNYPFALAFEWRAWQQLRRRISAGQFDVVLRLLPMSPVLPSPFAFLLNKGSVPFVIGPLNGGLPWPSGFGQLQNQREWVSNLRNLYRYLPFARSTYRRAAAIIGASSRTCAEFAIYRDKLFFVPEPGIASSLCSDDVRNPEPGARLELIFVGGLVPRKACDLALRAAAPILRNDLAHFTVVGDGPERKSLEQLVKSLGIEKSVSFCGWLGHPEVLQHLRSADVFVALASGAVPVVVDFGGPGDIVYPEVGCKATLTNENDVVAQMERILNELAHNRPRVEQLRRQGMTYARERLTWEAKAQDTTKVLNWVLGRGPKPDFMPPKMLATGIGHSSQIAAPCAGARA